MSRFQAPSNEDRDDVFSEEETRLEKPIAPQAEPRELKLVYRNIIVLLYYHMAGIYGLYLGLTAAKWATVISAFITYCISGIGVTAGSHRLWSHKSYKATKPLQLFLMLCQSVSNQHSVAYWVMVHRLHHKYSDTDADPHNATRGFFYSHMGWLMVRKHPEIEKRGKLLDLSDIYGNPYLKFQDTHYYWFLPLISFLLPTIIPMYFWGESCSVAWNVNMCRYVMNLNAIFLVNSVAHIWGYKPYDKNIAPSQNLSVSVLSLGEGFHNYHHVFPWDYKCDELSSFRTNPTTVFIELCAKLGLAYDLRSASDDLIEGRAKRTGDGSYLTLKKSR
ncbi:acyl-CoA Delta(11) desaturase-like [Bombyx mandarina]|uniref:Acyl-CoA Delta(11) desaturase-like n=1 Tax=Bombyx mandarina TaxID=7092 RepID=A0A6J2K228_BOMMA|nr:acyl-CoA Delta(11) desaturase-like [Bombyx mandarina]